MKRVLCLLAALAASMLPAAAQVWDFTGNNLLSGAYVFRELILVDSSGTGTVTRAVVVTGTMTFNSGAGTYSINASYVDSSIGSGSYTDTGVYSISPNGYGFMDHPYSTTGSLHGLVSNGVFVGSSTENRINDLFIAVPASSASVTTMNGNYTMDYYLLGSAGTAATSWGSSAQFNAASGSIGNVNVKTYLGNTTTPVNQTESGVTYSFTSGIGTISFPTTSNLAIRGTKQVLVSPDGNFIFGGSVGSSSVFNFDFFIGVRKASGTAPALSGLYYQAGLNHSGGGLDTYYGAFSARAGTIWEHQRYLATSNTFPINYTAIATYPSGPTNDYSDTYSDVDYSISQDGAIRIGLGQSPYLGLRVAVRGPVFGTAPSGAPYIFPTGIVNAASYSPFTAGVAPGELISIYGANLAGSTSVVPGGVPFPTTLAGVQVLMNNIPAALYFVSPGQIAVIVPYGVTASVVQIQVIRNGTTSNAVTLFRAVTNPGIFSQSASGEGLGAILRADYSLATEANPAKIGETVQIFLTGLGAVFPSISDGGLGSTNAASLNRTAPGGVSAYIGNVQSEVAYSGLAPGLAGMYQLNATIPAGAGSGNVPVEIVTADGDTLQVALPVSASASDAVPGPKAAAADPPHRR